MTHGTTPSETNSHKAAQPIIAAFHSPVDCAAANKHSPRTRILMVIKRFDGASGNPWHRLVNVHSSWFALRAAMWRLRFNVDSITGIDVLFTDAGEARKTLSEVPDRNAWVASSGYMGALYGAFGKAQSDGSMSSFLNTDFDINRATDYCEYSTVITAPDDGLLWDLAWDRKQGCLASHPTWQLFLHDLQTGLGVPPFGNGEHGEPDVHVCWSSRDGTTEESNSRQTSDAEAEDWISSTCQGGKPVKFLKLQFTGQHSMYEQASMVADCDVLMGVHGAGLMNHMFMEPGSALVEILPLNEEPAYYRNTAHFSQQIYFARKICSSDSDDCIGIQQNKRAGCTMKEDTFREVLEAAIASVSHKARRHHDSRVKKCQNGQNGNSWFSEIFKDHS